MQQLTIDILSNKNLQKFVCFGLFKPNRQYKKYKAKRYYLRKGPIKYYNIKNCVVITNREILYNQPVEFDIKQYDENKKDDNRTR